MTFQEEFLTLLQKHGIAYDERYLWVVAIRSAVPDGTQGLLGPRCPSLERLG